MKRRPHFAGASENKRQKNWLLLLLGGVGLDLAALFEGEPAFLLNDFVELLSHGRMIW